MASWGSLCLDHFLMAVWLHITKSESEAEKTVNYLKSLWNSP